MQGDNIKIVKYLKKESYTSLENVIRKFIIWYKSFYE